MESNCGWNECSRRVIAREEPRLLLNSTIFEARRKRMMFLFLLP
jgi:hypothetical protein